MTRQSVHQKTYDVSAFGEIEKLKQACIETYDVSALLGEIQ
jgi:hypothetical protein